MPEPRKRSASGSRRPRGDAPLGAALLLALVGCTSSATTAPPAAAPAAPVAAAAPAARAVSFAGEDDEVPELCDSFEETPPPAALATSVEQALVAEVLTGSYEPWPGARAAIERAGGRLYVVADRRLELPAAAVASERARVPAAAVVVSLECDLSARDAAGAQAARLSAQLDEGGRRGDAIEYCAVDTGDRIVVYELGRGAE